MMLDDSIRALIAKARMVGFDGWEDRFECETVALFQAADDAGVFLSDEVIALMVRHEGALEGGPLAMVLRDAASSIVDEARLKVLVVFPQILLPGGGLFPQERAIACWRDFWHFLRCVSYGVAAGRSDFLSPGGLVFLRQLYGRLQVPLDAMIVGVDALKDASLARFSEGMSGSVEGCFEQLRGSLDEFRH